MSDCSRWERLYRRLLVLYPRRVRERHGDQMARLFADRCADARRKGVWGAMAVFWLRTVVDIGFNVVGSWWEELPTKRGGGMDGLLKDAGYGLRALIRTPAVTLVAAVTIGLGIGASTAIFSVVEAVLLRPLPYPEPEELTTLWVEMRQRNVYDFPFAPPVFADVRDQAEAFEDVAAVFTFPQALAGDGDPIQVSTGFVSWNFFQVLGVEPALGRAFVAGDGDPGDPGPDAQPGDPVPPTAAILDHDFWQRRFGADPDVVGRTIEVGGNSVEVVGVLPGDFSFLMPPEAGLAGDVSVWVASRMDYAAAPRNNMFLSPVGRLRDGATIAQAQASLDAVSARIRELYQTSADVDLHFRAELLEEDLTRSVQPVILALMGAVAVLLLIACANVSGLMLVRASAREREMAVRAAVGGSRVRLVRQLLAESLMIGALGGVVGLVMARGGLEILMMLQPGDLPRLAEVGLNASVLGFTAVASVAAAVVFGVAPALQGSGVDLSSVLTQRGSQGASGGVRLVQKGVVVAEVALTLVLLVGAGLMIRSFTELVRVDPGFRPESTLTFGVNLPFQRYPTVESRLQFNRAFHERLESLPGARAVGGVFPLPLTDTRFNGRYGPVEALSDASLFRQADFHTVWPGYFEAMGTRLLAGRTFQLSDVNDSLPVVVIDRKLAEALWPGRSAVGERFVVRAITPEPQTVEVVGIVEHQRHPEIRREGRETVYYHDRWLGSFGSMTWVLRTDGDPSTLISRARAEAASLDPSIPLADVRPMTAYVDDSMASTRFALAVIGAFGAVALFLAFIGLYGVLSFVVRQRTSEIGVRMAFGAPGHRILWMVVRQGMALAVAGVALGLAAALVSTRALESMLVGVSPTDPLTYATIAVTFLAVAGLACFIPARRATRLDPVGALRQE